MSNKAPDSTRGHCERASDSLQRAAEILEHSAELRQSMSRICVNSNPPKPNPSVVLIRGVDGVLRVKKD